MFIDLRYNRDLDDRRGHVPDYSRDAEAQLTLNYSQEGLASYQHFLTEYDNIRRQYELIDGPLPDVFAFQINNLIYRYYKSNLNRSKLRDIFNIQVRRFLSV